MKAKKESTIKKTTYKSRTKGQLAEEPLASYTSRIRAIGNSNGVILNNQVIESAGFSPGADILIEARDGIITIIEAKLNEEANTNLASWDKQFKAVIKKGARPERDLFDGMPNKFDKKEW